ncbi:MAG: hypothetical protein ACLFQK_01695 [Fibrobacterota bacterium]
MFLKGFFLILLISMSAVRVAGGDLLGGSPGAVTRMTVSPIAESMGAATAALMRPGMVPSLWNPGAAALVKTRSLTTGYRLMSMDRRSAYISFLTPLPPRAGVSLGYIYHGDGNITLRDLDENVYEQNASFASHNINADFSLRISRRTSAGVNASVFYTKLLDVELYTVGAFDAGIFHAVNERITAGAVLKNINLTYEWNIEVGEGWKEKTVDKVPQEIRAGVCMSKIEMPFGELTAVSDLSAFFVNSIKEKIPELRLKAGAEWLHPSRQFAFRIGRAGASEYSIGAGFLGLLEDYGFNSIDYSITTDPIGAGLTHSFSFTYKWD